MLLPLEAVGTEAATVGLLAPVMQERIDRAGLRDLLADVELPLSSVLARIQAAGVRIDVEYLNEMSESLGDRMRTLEEDIYQHAGERFNIGSPPQLHHAQSLLALRHGAHVFCEKPFVERPEEADEIIAASQEHGSTQAGGGKP